MMFTVRSGFLKHPAYSSIHLILFNFMQNFNTIPAYTQRNRFNGGTLYF